MLTQNPKTQTDWQILADICAEKGVDMKIIIKPEKYKDDVSATKRAGVLREAHSQGIRISSLTSLCPMSEQWIRRVVNNGKYSPAAEPEPQAETVRAKTDGV